MAVIAAWHVPGTKTIERSRLMVPEAESLRLVCLQGGFLLGAVTLSPRPLSGFWWFAVSLCIFWLVDPLLCYLPSSFRGPCPVGTSVSRLPLYEDTGPIGSGACPTSG